MGFATSIKTNELLEITKKINISISSMVSECMFEEAISNNIECDEMYITETKSGSLITVGEDFPIFGISLKNLTENKNELLRFMFGETSSVFFFEYINDEKILRRKNVVEGEITHDKGKTLNLEFSGLAIDELIPELITQTCGNDFYNIEPDAISYKYKFQGKIEKKNNTENIQTTSNKRKRWWRF